MELEDPIRAFYETLEQGCEVGIFPEFFFQDIDCPDRLPKGNAFLPENRMPVLVQNIGIDHDIARGADLLLRFEIAVGRPLQFLEQAVGEIHAVRDAVVFCMVHGGEILSNEIWVHAIHHGDRPNGLCFTLKNAEIFLSSKLFHLCNIIFQRIGCRRKEVERCPIGIIEAGDQILVACFLLHKKNHPF